jgi:hypothetical protein
MMLAEIGIRSLLGGRRSLKGSRGRAAGSRQPRITVYRGIEMRSRLEALAAPYLDRYEFAWQYEPICFGGMGGQYLPDFRVLRSEKANVYLEVKPKPEKLEITARQQMQRMSVIWESEPDARLIIVLVTGYPDPHFLPLTGDPETGVFRWNLDELYEAIQGSWWLSDMNEDGGSSPP